MKDKPFGVVHKQRWDVSPQKPAESREGRGPEQHGGERIGGMVRARTGDKPMQVSQGHRVSLETSIRLTLAVTDGYRIPRPTRDADDYAGEIKKKVLASQVSEK